ncbi:hypothetical protein WJX73_000371 [Symbiochloris irregularis]|uniref:Protein tyrosine phosphatase n=1 Tax=Symbiochloris irregularis TaxID=706552 RepID=A0AAW1NZF2_9CHLO
MPGLESALRLTDDKLTEDGGKVVLYEFQRQKQKACGSLADATHPENDGRNRYSDVLAFDDTRVHLQVHDGSDYVNASHLTSRPGEGPSWHIIATQGPLPTTIEHFWQMVWEQHSAVVVMLTCCVESNHVKCANYFAEDAGKALHSGALRVDTASVHVLDDDIILRELLITPRSDPTAPPRRVRHYHYHAWPDRSVPAHAFSLRQLSRNLATHISNSQAPGAVDPPGPPVVHCSAGIGRTGVLCTVVIAMLRLRAVEPRDGLACRQAVSVKRIVAALRKQRAGMVQTFEQYRFCYQCIKEELQEQLGQPPLRLERPSMRNSLT